MLVLIGIRRGGYLLLVLRSAGEEPGQAREKRGPCLGTRDESEPELLM
jgi:hypothetical protein